MRYCPLCDSENAETIVSLNFALFDDLGMSGQMQLAQCHECGFFYNQTSLEENDFAEYYRKNQYYLDTTTSGSGGMSDEDFSRYGRIYNVISSNMPGKKHPIFLDYGCGKGGMLAWLSEHVDAELIGIEPSDACRKHAHSTLPAKVFDTLDQFQGWADVVVLSHVLEHTLSPRGLLDSLRDYCSDGSLIYIEVPRAESYLCEQLDWRQLYFEHINHFTEKSLMDMVMATGFEVVQEGPVCFIAEDSNSPDCLFMVVRPGTGTGGMRTKGNCCDIPTETLPATEIISEVLVSRKRISVWGISQYTQLILGSYPELLKRVTFLFDGSPAKIGRRIDGVEVRSSAELSLLGEEDILLISKSRYTSEMTMYLQHINFSGKAVYF